MSLYREWKDGLPFDPAERESILGCRTADEPQVARLSLALGAALAVLLATGGGVAPPVDWGAAFFFGLATAVFTRGLLLAWRHLAHGGWRAWRHREANEPAMDGISTGAGIGLALYLATGAGGIGPAFAPAEAALAGFCSALLTRALLGLARWP